MKPWTVIGGVLLLLSCKQGQPAIPLPRQGAAVVDYDAAATLEEDLETGRLQLTFRSSTPTEVFYEVMDQDGTVLADAVYRVNGEVETVADRLPLVRQWTAETPQLYTLHLQAGGRDSYHPLAFRRVRTWKKDTLLVNGCKVPIKGANLEQANREALKTLKEANVNTVNAFYLPRSLRELCDSAGLYLFPQPDSLDRPNPRTTALRHSRQELAIQPLDLEQGLFRIENRRRFASLEDYTLSWWVERDGKPLNRLHRHQLHFETAPGAAEDFRIGLPGMDRPGEYRLFFEAASREDRPLVAKGTVLATETFLLKDDSRKEPFPAGGTLSVTEGDTRLVFRGQEVEMVFDRAYGSVKSLRIKGRELLPGGMEPAFPVPVRALCNWSNRADSLVLQARYQLPEGERLAVFTLLGNGVLKVESPVTPFRIQAPASGLRYFGQAPDLFTTSAFKTRRETTGEPGWHPETSWLQLEDFTLVGTAPFSFLCSGTRLSIAPEQAFVLVPGKDAGKATLYEY